ncbi:hypothetical protein GOV03_03820 [Candidatus Woesearchaeota archaeon]|nr:hypothetical protein [Candidatus Woesearchaeota archaeon]
MTNIHYDNEGIAKLLWGVGESMAEELSKQRGVKISTYDGYYTESPSIESSRKVCCVGENKGTKKKWFGLVEQPILESMVMIAHDGDRRWEVKVKVDSLSEGELSMLDTKMAKVKEKTGADYFITLTADLSEIRNKPYGTDWWPN